MNESFGGPREARLSGERSEALYAGNLWKQHSTSPQRVVKICSCRPKKRSYDGRQSNQQVTEGGDAARGAALLFGHLRDYTRGSRQKRDDDIVQ